MRVCLLAWRIETRSDSVQFIVHRTALFPLGVARHYHVRYLERWHLTRQRKHLVRSDPGYNCSIATTNLANRFLHAACSEFSNVSQDCGKTLFTLGYVLSFTRSDGADSVLGKAKRFGNLQRTPIRVSE